MLRANRLLSSSLDVHRKIHGRQDLTKAGDWRGAFTIRETKIMFTEFVCWVNRKVCFLVISLIFRRNQRILEGELGYTAIFTEKCKKMGTRPLDHFPWEPVERMVIVSLQFFRENPNFQSIRTCDPGNMPETGSERF